jgi:hypothetical protein
MRESEDKVKKMPALKMSILIKSDFRKIMMELNQTLLG